MKIATLSRTRYAGISLLVFFFVLFVQTTSVNAVGLGFTEEAPIMGLSCGLAGAPNGKDKCCTIPGEVSTTQAKDPEGKPLFEVGPDGQPVLDGEGNPVPVYEKKQLVRAQFDMFGEGKPSEEKEKSGFINRIKSGVGTVLKVASLANPIATFARIASGQFGEFTKDMVEVMFKVSRPIINDVAQNQAEIAMDRFTENATSEMGETKTVNWRCDEQIGRDIVDENTGECTCKPLDKRSLDPNNKQTYVDWNQWILARVRPERKSTVAQVLGVSTLAQDGVPQFRTSQERADLIKSCSEIMDDFDRRTCMRIGLAIAPEFFLTCNKIRDPEEQEQCKQCIVGGDDNPLSDPTYGEAIAGMWTGLGCLPSDPGRFISGALLPWSVGIGGGVAMMVLTYAAFLYTTSRGNPDKLKKARDYLNSGLIGLLVIIFSLFLMQLLGLSILRIPFLFGGS